MRLSTWYALMDKLGVKGCAEESMRLVDLARHTSDPTVLVENPIYEAMLEDRLNDETSTNSQQDKVVSTNATNEQGSSQCTSL